MANEQDVLTDDAVEFLTRAGARVRAAPARSCWPHGRRERSGCAPASFPTSWPRRRASARATGGSRRCRRRSQDRRVEITGPVDRKMVINALNSGAKMFMADFEDSNSPTWQNCIEGQVNLTDALERTITLDTGEKQYSLNEDTATLLVRPRGWHLEERHFEVDGEPISASLFDFGLYFFRNHARGGRCFYLPKLESHLEARLWNDVFVWAQDRARRAAGTIKATVLIETILAAFEMDEILYELREHSAGLNAGRWDYIFSVIKKLGHRPEFVLPDRSAVTMAVPFMFAYTELLVKTCHARGAHAMGGMAAFIPSRRDPEVNEVALAKVREDKEREAGQGFDGTWVAHPDLVPVAMEIFDRVLGEQPQPARAAAARRRLTAADLLDVASTPGEITLGRPAQQRLGRDPVPGGLAARLGRRRDLQPDGGRRDLRDLTLTGLAVAPPRQGREHGRRGRDRGGGREARRRLRRGAGALRAGRAGRRVRRIPHAAGLRADRLGPAGGENRRERGAREGLYRARRNRCDPVLTAMTRSTRRASIRLKTDFARAAPGRRGPGRSRGSEAFERGQVLCDYRRPASRPTSRE